VTQEKVYSTQAMSHVGLNVTMICWWLHGILLSN